MSCVCVCVFHICIHHKQSDIDWIPRRLSIFNADVECAMRTSCSTTLDEKSAASEISSAHVGKLTSARFLFRIGLFEQKQRVSLLISKIVPLLSGVVMIHAVLRHQVHIHRIYVYHIGVTLYSPCITHSKWPVFHWPFGRLPRIGDPTNHVFDLPVLVDKRISWPAHWGYVAHVHDTETKSLEQHS